MKCRFVRATQVAISSMLSVLVFSLGAQASNLYDRLPVMDAKEEAQFEPMVRFMNVGRYSKAAFLLQNAGAEGSEKFLFQLLCCYYYLGNYPKLISTCDEWLKKNPQASNKGRALVFEFKGAAQFKAGAIDDAAESFDRAIDIDSNSFALAGRAEVYKQLNKMSLADEDLRKASRIIGTDGTPQSLRLLLDFASSQNAGAGVPVLEISPTLLSCKATSTKKKVKTLLKSAEKFENEGRFNESIDLYTEAANLCDQDFRILNSLALCIMASIQTREVFFENGKLIQAAERSLQKAICLNGTDWRLWNNLSVLKYLRNDKVGAQEALEKALASKDIPAHQKAMIRQAIRMCITDKLLREKFRVNSDH